MISCSRKIAVCLTYCLLTVALLTSVASYAQQPDKTAWVTVPKNEITLEELFKLIKASAGTNIFYSKDVLNDKEKITLKGGRMSLNEILETIVKEKKVAYAYKNGFIIFQRKEGGKAPDTKNTPAAKGSITVTGLVRDAKGELLPGVAVHAGNSGKQAITNAAGEFTISNINENNILKVSALGYETAFIMPNANGKMNITLKHTARVLDEVVVTALGIKREEKSLGYSTQKLDGSAGSDAPTNGVINALSGKVAGLNLTKSGGPMGSSRVILRGESILDVQSDGALIVVDGVPISTRFSGTGSSSYQDTDSPIDFGSALTDINPDDIESFNVLKGPAAAALYGSRASQGAIIITTKSGSKNKKGLGVSFSSNIAVDQINRWPDFQYEYGQGLSNASYYSYGTSTDGASTSNTSSAWGPKFQGQSYYQYNSPIDPVTGARAERVPWKPYLNNRKDFFQNGVTFTNSASVSGGNDNGNMRLSLTSMRNDWILPGTGYNRYTVAFSGSTKLSNTFNLSAKMNYTNKRADNLPNVGYNNQSISYFTLFQSPNIDLGWYYPYWQPGQEQVAQVHPFSTLIDNPYVIAREMINASTRHNVTGNVTLDAKITSKLSLMMRSSLDMGYEFRNQRRPKNTQKFQNGMYRQQTVFNAENNNDFLLKYVTKAAHDLNVTASVGGNLRNERRYFTNQMADNLAAPGVYNLANSSGAYKVQSERNTKFVNSTYGFVNLAWRNALFMDITARNDWSSSLPVKNRSYFYPSVSTAASLNELFNMPKFINLVKVRASFASTGYDAPLGTYALESTFESGAISGTATNPVLIPNPDLKPQRNIAYEIGTQWALFNNRINIDVTYYHQVTKDQIIKAPTDASVGYAKVLMNIGQVNNQGVEVMLKGSPVVVKNFNWQVTANWALNRNKVLKLTDAVGGSMVLNEGARGTLEAHEGRPLGDLYGIGVQRSPDGQVIFEDGLAKQTTDTKLLGNTAPDWRGGLANMFTYKNISLNVLFDCRVGGVMYSLSHAVAMEQGKLKESLPGRDAPIVGKGVMLVDGKYVTNTVAAADVSKYYDALYNRDVVENNLYSAGFVKLREATLQYTLPKKWFAGKGLKFIQGGSIGVYGRDLFVWTKFPLYDPETATLDNNTIIPGFETGQFPSTRTMGMNVKLNF
ncbi:TonB-linked outer membrane protein, SusC/RagA family [Filimonas lacunae]|uniref:TonB-linked outer membrane protein, SusC/RagA family n=1 Tax=Filimonas lacunae TaxID=477680 RepID=A0A173MDC7_9BACT|nr:SusC/RagA family TonB-linked outer membrane protein [Filimonas lacunae]BAV05451.1 TonB-dependent receptor [Filimonas lacunae]SIT21062.1 TonB-linked outer membrane protein, SusC/RagA family [Filimonas lacunae]